MLDLYIFLYMYPPTSPPALGATQQGLGCAFNRPKRHANCAEAGMGWACMQVVQIGCFGGNEAHAYAGAMECHTRTCRDVPDHAAFRFVPFAVETFGYMGKEAVKFVNRLGDIAAESGRIPKGAFVRWAMQLLSVTVQRGNADMYRRSGLVISREQGLRYDAGFAVPVLMS